MASRLTPARRRGVEYLDAPGVDPGLVRRSLADVSLANALFGGTRAVIRELDRALRGDRCASRVRSGQPPTLSLLDVGTGMGDIPASARRLAASRGIALETVGIDLAETLAAASRRAIGTAVRGNALELPFRDGAFDIVTCSQTLHHFADAEAVRVVRELDRVARGCVIISDLRRSWIAAAGIWLASFPLGFHPVSRHDGLVSVLRGYTADELRDAVAGAIGRPPAVRRHLGWRVTAAWEPEGAHPTADPPPVRARSIS
jgi:SAM-dependent methyltransferase